MFQPCRKGRRKVRIEPIEKRREGVGALADEGGDDGRVGIEEAGDYLVHLPFLFDHHQVAAVAEQHGLGAREKLRQSPLVRGGTMASWMPLIHSAWGGGNITSVNQSAQNASEDRTVPLPIMVNQRDGTPLTSH